MTTFSPQEIAAYYTARIPELKITRSREWRTKCPVHKGEDDNFAIDSTAAVRKAGTCWVWRWSSPASIS